MSSVVATSRAQCGRNFTLSIVFNAECFSIVDTRIRFITNIVPPTASNNTKMILELISYMNQSPIAHKVNQNPEVLNSIDEVYLLFNVILSTTVRLVKQNGILRNIFKRKIVAIIFLLFRRIPHPT